MSCGALPDPANGSVSTTGITFGDMSTYSCNAGFNLMGGSTRTCQASGATGVWSRSAPTCQRVLLFFIEFVNISNNVHFFRVLQQKLTYNCCNVPSCMVSQLVQLSLLLHPGHN